MGFGGKLTKNILRRNSRRPEGCILVPGRDDGAPSIFEVLRNWGR